MLRERGREKHPPIALLMSPDREWNPQPLGVHDDAQQTEPLSRAEICYSYFP